MKIRELNRAGMDELLSIGIEPADAQQVKDLFDIEPEQLKITDRQFRDCFDVEISDLFGEAIDVKGTESTVQAQRTINRKAE